MKPKAYKGIIIGGAVLESLALGSVASTAWWNLDPIRELEVWLHTALPQACCRTQLIQVLGANTYGLVLDSMVVAVAIVAAVAFMPRAWRSKARKVLGFDT